MVILKMVIIIIMVKMMRITTIMIIEIIEVGGGHIDHDLLGRTERIKYEALTN